MVKYAGRGLAVKRPGVLSESPDAESCLGGGGLVPFKHRQVTDLDVTDLGFSGPRIPFCATGALWGRVTSRLLDQWSKHLSSILGRTELCHEVRNPGP